MRGWYVYPLLAASLLAKSHPLVDTDFEKRIEKGTWFVKFFTQWCKHSRHLLPTWAEVAEKLVDREKKGLFFGEVDCDVGTATCNKYEITGYPTLLLYKEGVLLHEYNGSQDHSSLIKEATDQIPVYYKIPDKTIGPEPKKTVTTSPTKEADKTVPAKETDKTVPTKEADKTSPIKEADKAKPKEEDKSLATKSEKEFYNQVQTLLPTLPRHKGIVKSLTAGNFNATLQTNHSGAWMVEFFSPRCPHCQAFMPDYMQLANQVKPFINVAKVDCDAEGGFCGEMEVNGVPDLRMYNGGKFVEPYKGVRDLDLLKKFLKKYYLPRMQQVDTRTLNEKKKYSSLHTPFQPQIVLSTENIIHHYSRILDIQENLNGFDGEVDFFLIEDNYASLTDSEKFDGIALSANHGNQERFYPHPITTNNGPDYGLRNWVLMNQQPLATELTLEKVKAIDFNRYQVVLGYYAGEAHPAAEGHLRVVLQDINLAYQASFNFTAATNETLPLLFCFLPDPITSEQSQAILKVLNLPTLNLKLTSDATNPDYLLMDTSLSKYQLLTSSALPSAREPKFLVESLHNAQGHITEGEPLLVTETVSSGYSLLHFVGFVALIALLYYAFKRVRSKDDIEYSKLQ